MTTTKTETWRDLIPQLPLPDCVPALWGDDKFRREVVVVHGDDTPSDVDRSYTIVPGTSRQLTGKESDLILDLGKPQGFGYGLALWAKHVDACFYTNDNIGARRAYGITHSHTVRSLWKRHFRGETTDADRLVVANGLREME